MKIRQAMTTRYSQNSTTVNVDSGYDIENEETDNDVGIEMNYQSFSEKATADGSGRGGKEAAATSECVSSGI